MRFPPGKPLLFAAALALAAAPAWAEPAGGNHKITQSPSYVPLDPLYATVMDDGAPAGLLLVSIGLDIPDPALRARATAALPLLRDALVRSLMAYTVVAVRPREQPDVDQIVNRLQAVTDRTLQQPGAKVLIGQVIVRLSR